MLDSRIAYGANCVWWDSIDKVANKHGLPVCPQCSGVLFEIESIEEWNRGVDHFEKNNPSPGYRKFVDWLRGKCFRTQDLAMNAYRSEGGQI